MTSLAKKNVIIGAGLTGLSTAYHLKGNYSLFEKNSLAGGMASSDDIRGFTFDKAGHLFHFQTKEGKDVIKNANINSLLKKHKRSSWILSKNTYTRYPFQVNTYKLPPPVIKDCLIKMVQAQSELKKNKPVNNLKDWIMENFGEGIAKHFMFPYNQKLWQYPLSSRLG